MRLTHCPTTTLPLTFTPLQLHKHAVVVDSWCHTQDAYTPTTHPPHESNSTRKGTARTLGPSDTSGSVASSHTSFSAPASTQLAKRPRVDPLSSSSAHLYPLLTGVSVMPAGSAGPAGPAHVRAHHGPSGSATDSTTHMHMSMPPSSLSSSYYSTATAAAAATGGVAAAGRQASGGAKRSREEIEATAKALGAKGG